MIFSHTIGIDEAGRGPLAGPVAVGVVLMPKTFNKKLLKGIRDSKKLTESGREMWYAKMQQWKDEGKINFHVSLVSAKIIDTKGISYAIRQGIKNSLRKVKADASVCSVLLDGSLKAPEEFMKQKTIIKGDEKEAVISLASIAAKVTRDRKMVIFGSKLPQYGFEIHKGYGTAIHRKNIVKHGFSSLHRLTFCTKLEHLLFSTNMI